MILTELAERGVHAEVTVADGPTGTFLLADGEVRVDRGVSHDLVVPDRVEADAVLVSGYVPAAGEALAAASAEWIALDAAHLVELPPGANVVFASGEQDVHALADGRRLAVVTHGADGRDRRRGRSRRAGAPGEHRRGRPRVRRRLRSDAARGARPRPRARGRAGTATQAALDSLG